QAKGARVVPGGQRDDDLRREITERGELADALHDAQGHHAGSGRRVAGDAHAGQGAGLTRPFHDVERRTQVTGLDDLQGHLRLGDDPVDPALVERRRTAVDVAAHVGSQLQEDLVVDRARAWDGRSAAVRHDTQTV